MRPHEYKEHINFIVKLREIFQHLSHVQLTRENLTNESGCTRKRGKSYSDIMLESRENSIQKLKLTD